MSKQDTFICRADKDGKLNFSEYNRSRFKEWLKTNHGRLLTIKPKQIESGKQRGWFEAGLIPFIAYHQEYMDHKNPENLHEVREWLKIEFNADFVKVGGKAHKVAKSTSGALSEGLVERIMAWAEEQGMPIEVLEPERYKNWRDTIYPYGGPDNYIDYLVSIKLLNKMTHEEQRKAVHSAIDAGEIPAPEIVSWVMKYNSSKRMKKISKKRRKEIATHASHSRIKKTDSVIPKTD